MQSKHISFSSNKYHPAITIFFSAIQLIQISIDSQIKNKNNFDSRRHTKLWAKTKTVDKKLDGCKIVGSVFEQFANYCPKLKRINVETALS